VSWGYTLRPNQQVRELWIVGDARAELVATAHESLLRRRNAHIHDACGLTQIEAADIVEKEGPDAVLVHASEVASDTSQQIARDDLGTDFDALPPNVGASVARTFKDPAFEPAAPDVLEDGMRRHCPGPRI
jgi:hypothetical protein